MRSVRISAARVMGAAALTIGERAMGAGATLGMRSVRIVSGAKVMGAVGFILGVGGATTVGTAGFMRGIGGANTGGGGV